MNRKLWLYCNSQNLRLNKKIKKGSRKSFKHEFKTKMFQVCLGAKLPVKKDENKMKRNKKMNWEFEVNV